MRYLDRTYPDPARNLACDEALLDLGEEGCLTGGVLRFWEPDRPFVVLGFSKKADEETRVEGCRRLGIPVLRRSSGGGTVLQGPGCLNYALVLPIEGIAAKGVRSTNTFVMERNRAALETILGRPVTVRGHTDLCLGERKFSGNAQRRKRRFFLFHGTFLLGLDLDLVERTLTLPAIRPDYRMDRPHADFLMNLAVKAEEVKTALARAWEAGERFGDTGIVDARTAVPEQDRR